MQIPTPSNGRSNSADAGSGFALTVPRAANDLVTLYQGALGEIYLARCSRTDRRQSPKGYIHRPHFFFPLSGSYIWHAGGEDVFADANRVLFFSGEQEFATSHPVSGDLTLGIWPSDRVIDDLFRRPGANDPWAVFHKSRWWSAGPKVQVLSRLLVRQAFAGEPDLAIEETTLDLLRHVGADSWSLQDHMPMTGSNAVDQAKEFMHASARDRWDGRIGLNEVADAIGLNPIYLSQLFTRSEGIPLYKYMRKLRLSTSLGSLGECDDITELALRLGFSSHSHFSAAFRKTYGQSPSAVRSLLSRAVARPKAVRLPVQALMPARGGFQMLSATTSDAQAA